MTRDARKLYIVRDPDGDHSKREFADIYMGESVVGGLFCSPEQLVLITSVFNSYNQTLDAASQVKE